MTYILDTDSLIFMIRGLKSARRPDQRKRAANLVEQCRAAQNAGDKVAISAITVSELEFGAHQSGDYEREMSAVQKVLTPFRVLEYDGVVCPAHYGRVRYELETKGLPIGSMDTLIAAHALALNATLVSNNLAHFSRVSGLTVVTWLKELR
ncbi:MAG TPA: type II toxin-antitoxin system VapC family toxin [Pirellulales bacterium]